MVKMGCRSGASQASVQVCNRTRAVPQGWWSSHLEASQRDGQGHVQRSVDDSGHRFDERHEEQREPDDADQQQDDQPPHPVLHHTLLLLPAGLRVPLGTQTLRDPEARQQNPLRVFDAL